MSTTSILKTSLTGQHAFKTWLRLAFTSGERIWLKHGQDQFFTGTVNQSGKFPLWETRGSNTNRHNTDYHQDAYQHLAVLATEVDGGVFYLPGKPTDYPLKDYCFASDDIGAEMDDGTPEEQWQQLELIAHLSGLTPGYIISSGSKSYHGHWKLAISISIAQRTFFAWLTAIALLGDPAVTNPHQPMRAPGFFRKEKGKEQTLEFHSEARYTPEEFEQGMQQCFAVLGYKWHSFEDFSQARWQEVRRVLSGKLPRDDKQTAIAHLLALPESELPENLRRQQQKVNSERRAAFIGQANNLIDAVEQASERLGSDVFDWAGHNWRWSSSNHARGCCPWHDSTSGTAGWIAPRPNGNGWGYACQACTDNRQMDAFTYQWRLKHGLSAAYPKGKQWADAAKEFCQLAGVSVPEWISPEYAVHDPSVASEEWEDGYDRYKDSQELENFLGKTLKQFKKFTAKAYKRLTFQEKAEPTPDDNSDKGVISFAKGDRLKLISVLVEQAAKEGRKLRILDTSETGSGKSHEWGEISNKLLGVDKLFYCSPTHRNPSTATVEKHFIDLPVRHNGLFSDEDKPKTPSGKSYVRWAKKDLGEQPNITATCKNADQFHIFADKGYHKDVNAKAGINPICKKCKFALGCAGIKDKEGNLLMQPVEGYTYRLDRQKVLQAYAKIRASLDSLPNLATMQEPNEKGEPGLKPGVIVDEFHTQYKPTNLTQVTLAEFDSAYLFLETRQDEFTKVLPKMRKSIKTLRELLDNPPTSNKQSLSDVAKNLAEMEFNYEFIAGLLDKIPSALQTVKPIVYAIRRVLAGEEIDVTQSTYYGWNELQLREVIGDLPEGLQDAAEVLHAVRPNLMMLLDDIESDSVSKSSIQGSAKDKQGSAESLKYIRSQFNRDANKEKRDRIKNLPANCIVPILKTLLGERGSFRVKHGTLEIITANDHHKEQLLDANFLVVLDATLTPQVLADSLGIDQSEIVVICEERKDYSNLTIKHVRGLGKLTRNRSLELNTRVEALLSTLEENHPEQLAVIDHMSTKRSGDGHWFNHSRATNEYQHKQALATLGSPYQDIGALAMIYATVTGDKNAVKGNPRFDAYVRQFKDAEMIQAGGRLRAHRRPDEPLTWYAIVDEDISYLKDAFPGATFESINAFDINPDAGRQGERSCQAIIRATAKLLLEKLIPVKDLRQEDVGKLAGFAQSTVSKLFSGNPLMAQLGGWKGVTKIFQALVGTNRTWNILKEKLQSDFDEDQLFIIETYLPLFLQEHGQDIPAVVAECIHQAQNVGWKAIQAFLHFIPMEPRVNILSFLFGLINDEWRSHFLEVATE